MVSVKVINKVIMKSYSRKDALLLYKAEGVGWGVGVGGGN
jgi:hypothetical protein